MGDNVQASDVLDRMLGYLESDNASKSAQIQELKEDNKELKEVVKETQARVRGLELRVTERDAEARGANAMAIIDELKKRVEGLEKTNHRLYGAVLASGSVGGGLGWLANLFGG